MTVFVVSLYVCSSNCLAISAVVIDFATVPNNRQHIVVGSYDEDARLSTRNK